MVSLRSKLHLARQGRKSSPRLLSDSPCLLDNEYDAAAATAAPTQRAGSPSAPEPSHLPSWSAPRRLALDTLPEELVQKVAIFCGSDAILGLRHTCRTLHRALDTPNFLAEITRRRVSLLGLFFLLPPHDLFLLPKELSHPASCVPGPRKLSTLLEGLGQAARRRVGRTTQLGRSLPIVSPTPKPLDWVLLNGTPCHIWTHSAPTDKVRPSRQTDALISLLPFKDGPSHQWNARPRRLDRNDQDTDGQRPHGPRPGRKERRIPLPRRNNPPEAAGPHQSSHGPTLGEGTDQGFGQGSCCCPGLRPRPT